MILKDEINKLIQKIDQENQLFKNKSALSGTQTPKNIIGRQKQVEQLVRFLHSPKQGTLVPFVSVYGRSGSGKSTLVRLVCENLEDIAYCFVNLRNAKTIFGCANLILSGLDYPNLKSAQGLGLAIDNIEQAITSKLKKQKKNSFVLVLDEFDVIFYDRRNNPSDFIYKLVILGENLRKKHYQLCIVGISNDVASEYALDDRIRSRIGNSEIFFPSYTQKEALEILQDRANDAFNDKIDDAILQYCATLGAQEHGDARRVIDLLRVGSEIANTKNETITKSHINLASARLQNDRIAEIIGNSSTHFRSVCAAIASLTFFESDDCHYTSAIYNEYLKVTPSDLKGLSYRRISEILADVANTGLITSQTSSRGRHGYGTQYKLLFPPKMIGTAISEEWWEGIVKRGTAADEKKLEKQAREMIANVYKNPLLRSFPRF